MTKPTKLLNASLGAVAAALLLSACTAEQWKAGLYETGQNTGRESCRKLPEYRQMQECLARYQTPYEQYRKEREQTGQ